MDRGVQGGGRFDRLLVDDVISQRRRGTVPDERRIGDDLGFAWPTGREVVILAGCGLLVLLGAWAALGQRWWRLGLVGEWATYMVLGVVLLSWRPFRSAISRSGWLQKAAVVACFLLLAIGQFIGGGRQTFPLVRFAMFTDPASQAARYCAYLGVTGTGHQVQVDPVALYPSLARGSFTGRLCQSAEAAVAGGPGSDAGRAFDDQLLALLKRQNMGGDQLVRLDVYLVQADLDPPPRHRSDVRAQRVWSVEAER
jgi:hypothetical protein